MDAYARNRDEGEHGFHVKPVRAARADRRSERLTVTDLLSKLQPGVAIAGLWIAFVVSWAGAALWADRTEKRETLGKQAPYRLLLVAGLLLFLAPAHGYEGWMRLWHVNLTEA